MLLNLQPIIIVTETQIKYGMGFYQIKKKHIYSYIMPATIIYTNIILKNICTHWLLNIIKVKRADSVWPFYI
jgi:hypothetical protein